MTEPAAIPCPICQAPFVPIKRGAHVRKFCGVPCKRIHERTVRSVGEAAIRALGASRATEKWDEKAPT